MAGIIFKLCNLFRNKESQSEATINEVLFYGSEENKRQVGLNNLFCIYYVIIHARKTIDLCIPSLVSETIIKCLITVQEKNSVRIRIAIHNSDKYSNLKHFARKGFEVKVIKSDVRLEHDFMLIDAEGGRDAVAVMGSLDYEINRVNCNRDTSLLTSEAAVILPLKKEFDRVWNCVPDILKCDKD